MRRVKRVVRLPMLAAAVLLALPITAQGAVERDASGALRPHTGAELVEAAAIAKAEALNPAIANTPAIRLDPTTYAVDRTLELVGGSKGIEIFCSGPGPARITNAGAPRTLLRTESREFGSLGLDSSTGDPVTDGGIDFELTGTSASTFPVVEIRGGGTLRHIAVTVGSGTPNVTGVRMVSALGRPAPSDSGVDAILSWAQVDSAATNAPAIRASPGSTLNRVQATGGSITLDVAEDAGDTTRNAVLIAKSIFEASAAAALTRFQGGSDIAVDIVSSLFARDDERGPLIQVLGATFPQGTLAMHVHNSELIGGTSAFDVLAGSGSKPFDIRGFGLVILDADQVLACSGNGNDPPPAQVRLETSYREGAFAGSDACTATEVARVTGDPQFVDRAAGDLRPRWGSPLIDTTTEQTPAGPEDQLWSVFDYDLAFGTRSVAAGAVGQANVPAGTPVPRDTGVFEYQNTPPAEVDGDYVTLGNRGLTVLFTDAYDPDPLEDPDLEISWRLPDGSVQTGSDAEYRFRPGDDNFAELTVTDVSGLTATTRVYAYPYFALDEPATDDPDYVPPAPPGDVPLGDGSPLVPTSPTIDRAPLRPTPTPRVTTPPTRNTRATPPPKTFASFNSKRKSIRAGGRKASGYGKARKGEGQLDFSLARRSVATVTVARLGKGAAPLPKATFTLAPASGEQSLRLSSRIGRARLKPGSYRVTVTVPGALNGQTETRSAIVRVRR